MSREDEISVVNGGVSYRRGGNQASQSTEGLVDEFKNLVSDIEDFISSATSLSGEQLERAKNKVRTRIQSAKEVISEAGDTAWVKVRHSAEVADEYVHEKPWTAVGVGLAVGFITGIVCGRRIH